MTDYQQLQMSVEVSLDAIQSAIDFESTLYQPNYSDALEQLKGISLVLIPFPELGEKADKMLEELQELRNAIDLQQLESLGYHNHL